MNKLREVYREISENAKLKSEIQSAKKTFELKPFVEEWYKVKQLAIILHPTLSIFSIITGFGFLFYQFAGNLNAYLSVVLAVVLLVLLEFLKSEISSLTFKRFYLWGNHSLNYGLLFFALTFFALSIFLSVNGAKEIYKHLDKSEMNFKVISQFKADSLEKIFDDKIKTEKQTLESFRQSVSWQDRINVSDKTVSTTLQSLTARIDSLEKDKRQNLTKLQSYNQESLKELQSNNDFNLSFWFGLSLSVEFLIIICLWFGVWYQYRVSLESELFSISKENNEIDFNTLQQLAKFFLLNNQSMPLLNEQKTVGFDVLNKTQNQENLNGNQENLGLNTNQSKVKDYSGLINDLKAGIKDYRTLTRKHKVNPVTIKKFARKYENK